MHTVTQEQINNNNKSDVYVPLCDFERHTFNSQLTVVVSFPGRTLWRARCICSLALADVLLVREI